jgi:MFS family permease
MAGRTVPFFTAVAIDALGTGLFAPLSLLYFAKVPKIDLVTVGVLLSVAAALTLPMPVLVGQLVDRVGARPVVIGAQFAQAAGFLGYLAVTGPATLLVAAFVVAAGQRAFWSSVFTLIADLSARGGSPAAPERWYALVGMAQTAGLGAGGLLSGLLLSVATEATFRLLVAVDAASFLVAAVLLLFLRAPRHTPVPAGAGGYRALLADRPYLGLIATNTVFALCSMFISLALPVYVLDGLDAPPWIVGPLLAGNMILLALGQTTAVRIVRPLTRTRALALAGALWAVWATASALAVRVPTAILVPYLVVCTLCFTAAELVHAPVSMALASEAAPAALRGRYLAVFQYSFAIATVVAPGFFSVLFARAPALPWFALAALALLGAAAALLLERRLPRDAVTVSPAG